MEEKKNEGSVLPISTILVTMAVIGGMWFYAMPLKGTRPVTDANVCCEEKVQARLWQDPFSAVSKYKKATNMTYRSVSTTKIPAKIAKIITDNGNVTVLGVMVFGGPYAEEAEGRLRKRYAIVSALSRLDYASEDPQHIEYFESELLESDDTYSGIEEKLYRYINKKQNQTLTVPFEWFTKENEYDKNMSSTVLLLWLNDDMFQLEPLQNLSHLIGKIKEKVGTEVEGKAKCLIENNLDFKILGPAGSTNLVAMIEEAGNITNKKGGSSEDFSSFQIYSPFATAHKSLLFSKALGHIDTGCSKYVADYINEGSGGKIKLIRTIASDRDLCDSLLKELKLRRVDPIENNGNHIALIAEWDTFYGRSLPKTFINFVVKSGSESHKKRLHRFSYLRGIDGQLPGQSQLKPDRLETGEETKAKKELMDTGFMHRPTGRNQYDYLLRLTRQIHQLKKELVKKGERLKAIGVLGSDIYDKLLILQAMRQHFPDMIFFTTDLDARLLHPDEFKWARSLIVASSFGLRLHEDIQYTIPAFRDNYQTSLFFSTILALKASDKVFIKGGISQQSSILQSLQPRMFEIGRRGAFDLTDNIQNNGKKISISLMKDGQKKR